MIIMYSVQIHTHIAFVKIMRFGVESLRNWRYASEKKETREFSCMNNEVSLVLVSIRFFVSYVLPLLRPSLVLLIP